MSVRKKTGFYLCSLSEFSLDDVHSVPQERDLKILYDRKTNTAIEIYDGTNPSYRVLDSDQRDTLVRFLDGEQKPTPSKKKHTGIPPVVTSFSYRQLYGKKYESVFELFNSVRRLHNQLSDEGNSLEAICLSLELVPEQSDSDG